MVYKKDKNVGGFVIMWIVTVAFLFIVSIALFTSGFSIAFCLIMPFFLFMLIFFWYLTIKDYKNSKSMDEHIKNWTVIIKKATIQAIKEHKGNNFSDNYLIIIASDWSSTFNKRVTVWDRQTFSGCAIWDVVDVYVDPNNPKNYEVQI